MHRIIANKFSNLLPKLNKNLFTGKDPKKTFEQIKEYLKKTKRDIGDSNEPINNKYFIGAGIYIALCFGLYELKKERSIVITNEEVMNAIKKSETTVIYVLKQKEGKVKNEKKDDENKLGKKTNFRKIYLKIDGVDYVSFVSQVDIFYHKIHEIQKNKTTEKVKIIQKEESMLDSQIIRFFTAVNKVILPLIFPILLFNSSLGKMFKSKVLGQTDGFRPNIKFKDIAGLGNSKIQISELVDFLKNPAKYKKIGARVPKGALLSGPPGTGKTMLAKACAGEADVPFFSVSGSQFVQLYAGMGATRVRDLFKNAKKQTPAIIFIDQIDAIGRKRDDKFGGAHDERANTLNQLLVEMDGFGTNEDIIILAATNRKEMLDNALTRPGRFDRLVQIQLPDIRGRQQILELYLNKIKLNPKQTLNDYSRRLATLTYGFSGADLANLCNQAAILAVRKKRQFVDPDDFQSASDRVLAGLEQNLNLEPEQKKKIAYHEAGHAVVAWFSQGASPLLKITIVPRSKGSLGFAQYLPSQSSLMNRRQLYDQLCVILAGRMSEQFFFQQVTNGAADDLQKVRNLARSMVISFGMSQTLPNYAPSETQGQNLYSEQTSKLIDKEIMKIIQECTDITKATVKRYKNKIKALAEQVLKKESLNHQEIKTILGERPFPMKQNYKQFLQNVKETTKASIVI